MRYDIPLEPEKYYHIYNRGNNGDRIFYNEENYKYFLIKFNEYLSIFLNVFSYCLLPNHFHFLIQVKREEEIRDNLFSKIEQLDNMIEIEQFKKRYLKDKKIELMIADQFKYFFISYTKSINKSENHHGSLFEKPFKRIHIDSEEYFRDLIWYIHNNPVKHQVHLDYKNYKWNTYNKILSNKKTNLEKQKVLYWFESKESYIDFHKQKRDLFQLEKYIID